MSETRNQPLPWTETPAYREMLAALAAHGFASYEDAASCTKKGTPIADYRRFQAFQLDWQTAMQQRCGLDPRVPRPAVELPRDRKFRHPNTPNVADSLSRKVLGVLGETPEEAMQAASVVVALDLPRGDGVTNQVSARLHTAYKKGLVKRRLDKRRGTHGARTCWAYWRAVA